MVTADYALTKNLLFSLSPTIYQDLNGIDGESADFPLHHLILSFKYGGIELLSSNLKVGVLTSVLVPLTDKNNIYGELYTGGGIELGGNLLLSYYTDKYFPDESFSIHANIGYYNFQDQDQDLSHNSTPIILAGNVSAVNYSLGIKLPASFMDMDNELFLEYWGQKFITRPPVMVYSREDISFVTFGVKFTPKSFLSFQLAGDLLVTGDDDETTYGKYGIRYYPSASYPDYKLSFGVKFNIIPMDKLTTVAKPVDLPARSSESVNFEMLYQDNAQNEKVEQIKAIRMDIEKNLRQIREALKGDYDSGNQEEE
ncbi:hypothetical protein [Chloroherpeton thalassium]|nr:hypothetical protein [Chloroherpeton thalassium]